MRHVTAWILLATLLHVAPPLGAAPLPRIRIAPDGRSFVDARGRPFVPFGVNYFRPGTGWAPQVWKQFDPEATRRDFERLREMGANCIRVFLTHGSFAPTPDALDPVGAGRLDQLLDLVEAAGLYVHPTGLDHWEGTPSWARGDRFADETLLRAQEEFWSRLAARLKGRSVVFAYDLLNEPTVGWTGAALEAQWNAWVGTRFASAAEAATAWGVPQADIPWGRVPPPPPENRPGDRRLLDYQRFRESVADDWTRRQAAAIKAADPDALVTVGLIQWSVPALLPSVRHYSAFRPSRQAPFLDFLEIHFYPLEHGAHPYRGPEGASRNLAYLESVVRETARPGKPVVIAEFGWYGGGSFDKQPKATEEDQADWCGSLVETTRGLAVGWLNWGLYDHPEAKDVTRLTGLLTADGREKAWGRRFRVLAAALAGKEIPAPPPAVRPALDWDRCVTDVEAGHAFRKAYYRAFAGRGQ